MEPDHGADEVWWQCVEPAWDIVLDQAGRGDASWLVPESIVQSIALRLSASEILNGGIAQFFWNSSGALFPELVAALQAIDRREIAEAIQQGAAYFAFEDIRSTAMRRHNVRLMREMENGTSENINILDDLLIRSFGEQWSDMQKRR